MEGEFPWMKPVLICPKKASLKRFLFETENKIFGGNGG
jgi:hypothetical protein